MKPYTWCAYHDSTSFSHPQARPARHRSGWDGSAHSCSGLWLLPWGLSVKKSIRGKLNCLSCFSFLAESGVPYLNDRVENVGQLLDYSDETAANGFIFDVIAVIILRVRLIHQRWDLGDGRLRLDFLLSTSHHSPLTLPLVTNFFCTLSSLVRKVESKSSFSSFASRIGGCSLESRPYTWRRL